MSHLKTSIHRALALALTLMLVAPIAAPQQKAIAVNDSLDGFSANESAAERKSEDDFRATPTAQNAREHLRRLTAEPHVAGTPEDYQTALYVRDAWRAAGLNVEIKEYQVMLAEPVKPSVVELIRAAKRERLALQEDAIPQDPSSSNPKIIPLFNGYSASGDVTAPLLYVNYGLPDDYEALKKIGVSARGRIAIARYGRSFRGVKAKVAEENGASGLIIYSDPADDGYMQGDVYPAGPWRPASSAQRGSVEYIFEYSGDPLTPGTPSIAGVRRLAKEQATNLPRIPVQPISYGDARRLLENLRGPVRPRNFQGGLPFAYHIGGTDDIRVHLKTEMSFPTRTIWNVIARLDGSDNNGGDANRWVILGNHRDAWTFGAVDPNSGTAAMLEIGRGLGRLLKEGWRPRRTMLLCSWDAEEQGLIGSTEWAEENAAELKEKAVAYLNIDAAVSGPNFGAASVPSLWRLIRDVTRDVRDPQTKKTIYEAWQDKSHQRRGAESASEEDAEQRGGKEATIGALGSGSDYTPFLQHLGVPSLDFQFGGDYGVYHSAYDSFHWMEKFGDPTFAYHVAAAQVLGTLALRLADARALPFHYEDYGRELERLLDETQKAAERHELRDAFDAKPLREEIKALTREAERTNEARARALADNGADAERKLNKINDAYLAAERALTDEKGLRARAWYKHQIYAPGYYTGYAALPLPDLRQAVDDRNTSAAGEAAARLTEAVKRVREILQHARD